MKSCSYITTIEKFDDGKKLYLIHVKVPKEIFEEFNKLKIKRVLTSINGSTPTHNAFLSAKEKGRYIKLSKDVLKEKSLSIGQEVEVSIVEDTSRYGMPIAEEMKELLIQDPEGEAHFHNLTPGKIRSLLFKVNGYKTSNARIEKAIIILEHLKSNHGLLDWKMLNEAMKKQVF